MVVEESRNYSAGVGLVANTVNVSFPSSKMAMQGFTQKIVQMMKNERLFASQGGPIILSQVWPFFSLYNHVMLLDECSFKVLGPVNSVSLDVKLCALGGGNFSALIITGNDLARISHERSWFLYQVIGSI